MRGEPRPGCTVIQVVVNEKLLTAFDATLSHQRQRSKAFERWMRQEVLKHHYAETADPAILRDVLELID